MKCAEIYQTTVLLSPSKGYGSTSYIVCYFCYLVGWELEAEINMCSEVNWASEVQFDRNNPTIPQQIWTDILLAFQV